MNTTDAPSPDSEPKTLPRVARRVLAVLVEKAKTTPDNYPLSVASLVSGCNQKSNRNPQMQLDEDDVIDALDHLRSIGAAREVQGSGRVNKYRHAAYDWFDINSPEAAILMELLLRGPQTAGELRSRASRMEPFADLASVNTTLQSLTEKQLVRALSPPGRGQQFAHTLYESHEIPKLETQATGGDSVAAAATPAKSNVAAEPLQELHEQIATLESRIAKLEATVSTLVD